MKFVPISFQILTMPQHPRTQPLLLEERHVQTCSIKLDASEKGVPERKKTMLNKTMLGEMLSWVYDEGMLVLEIVCGKASGRLCELVSAVCWTCIQWRTGGAMKSKHTKTPSHSSRPRLQGYMRKLFYMMDHDGTILSNFFTEAGLLDSLWQKIASKHLSLGVHLGHFDWTRKKRQTN